MRFGKTKGEIRVEKGDFRGDFFVVEGFGPCLGISQPHLGENSQKNVFFLDTFPYKLLLIIFRSNRGEIYHN